MSPELLKAFEDFKVLNARYMQEVEKYGKAASETKEQLDRVQDRLDQIEAGLARKNRFPLGTAPAQTEQKTAYFKALRGQAGPEELKSLSVSSDPGGGYLAPPEFVSEIIAESVEYSPVRKVARIRTTTRPSISQPKKTGRTVAQWVGELGARTEQQSPTVGMENISTHEMYGLVKASKQDLEDSGFDVEQFVREDLGEQFGLAEGQAFISGNAVGKPEGLLVSPDIAFVKSGDANKLTADGLIELYFELSEAYVANATWLLSRSTLRAIRQLKNSVTGEYVWAPGIRSDGRPATILDLPYVTCPDMPAIAANAYPVMLGDFRRGYTIVDRIQMETMIDPYTSKANGLVEISARKRVGGQVVLPAAIKKLKIAA